MTNPGGFQFSSPVEWQAIPNSQGILFFAESTGSPDPTMNNIVHVVRKAINGQDSVLQKGSYVFETDHRSERQNQIWLQSFMIK